MLVFFEGAEIERRRHKNAAAVVKIIGRTLVLVDEADAVIERAVAGGPEDRTRVVEFRAVEILAAKRETARGARGVARVFRRDVHNAAERGDTVEERLRAAGDFLSVDVHDIGDRVLPEAVTEKGAGIETADVDLDAVAVDRIGVTRTGGAERETVGGGYRILHDAGAVFQRLLDIDGADIVDELAGDDFDREGDLLDRHVETSAGRRVGREVTAVLRSIDAELGTA